MANCDFLSVLINIYKYQKAIEIVKKATDEDSQGNYNEAYILYSNALDYFLTAIKCNLFYITNCNNKS